MKTTLRKIKSSDSKYFLKWWKDDELIKLTSGTKESSDDVLLGYFNDMLESSKDHHYMISINDEIIAHIALLHKNKDQAEISIVIGVAKYRGKGVGPIAIQEAAKIAFEELNYKKIILEVRPENVRAIKAYEKCGFVLEGKKKYPGTSQPVTLLMSLEK